NECDGRLLPDHTEFYDNPNTLSYSFSKTPCGAPMSDDTFAAKSRRALDIVARRRESGGSTPARKPAPTTARKPGATTPPPLTPGLASDTCVHLGKRLPGQPCGGRLYHCNRHNCVTTRFIKCSQAQRHCPTCPDYKPSETPPADPLISHMNLTPSTPVASVEE